MRGLRVMWVINLMASAGAAGYFLGKGTEYLLPTTVLLLIFVGSAIRLYRSRV